MQDLAPQLQSIATSPGDAALKDQAGAFANLGKD